MSISDDNILLKPNGKTIKLKPNTYYSTFNSQNEKIDIYINKITLKTNIIPQKRDFEYFEYRSAENIWSNRAYNGLESKDDFLNNLTELHCPPPFAGGKKRKSRRSRKTRRKSRRHNKK
jgi:hypothetical protein